MKNPWTIIGLVTVLLFAGAFYFAGQAKKAGNEGIEIITHAKGNAESAVVLTEYSDFQCPACGATFPLVTQLLNQYADDLRFEYKHFPIERLHPYALQAAMAAEAAGQQGKFFEFHDLLFENQDEWSRSATPNLFFAQYAEQLGLDMDQFKRQSNASALRDKVQAEMAEGRDLGITGTPTFFLNGQIMRGPNGEPIGFDEIALRVALAIDPTAASTTIPQNENPDVVGEGTGETVRFGI